MDAASSLKRQQSWLAERSRLRIAEWGLRISRSPNRNPHSALRNPQ